jgi:parallel beta-helix repeat protein
VIEENTAIGNANGIYLAAGTQGNIIRQNILVGNPPVQVAVDHTSATGVDIKSLADDGANVFRGNVCLTSVNAPCPAATPPSLTATPNPIPVTGSATVGRTTIMWIAPEAGAVEVHVGSPNGELFASGGPRGSAQTGVWVADGMTFYLQDVSGGKPLTADNTLATVVVRLQRR